MTIKMKQREVIPFVDGNQDFCKENVKKVKVYVDTVDHCQYVEITYEDSNGRNSLSYSLQYFDFEIE